MSKRFMVEVKPDSFHEVGADEMRVNGGALEFWIDGTLQLVYAANGYISAAFDYEDEQEAGQ